ncbi:LytR/AlgR family response regulator transcription factor [Bittarella massiliensis (ex Durand et al. 2017)]|uniref:LytR/AlgR family response regulator transcription factor n=1 Tax=Bittarella massiliensis (ex Durand et al. 2017) TaxID=1720313 RepID=UPI001AA1BB76|nr:LytTR family DNA-binding domain-containing protein [Bittarella massiliensis (ex Durand et al. 2017)]MBO1678972.1 response regulator transcription factor [Bittarella massiliensis (ex Durand et al. 2017)]
MKIAICDDDRAQLETLEECLIQYRGERGCEIQWQQYDSSAQLLEEIQAGARYDIYLLDVLMPEVDGIRLGEEIRRTDWEAALVYLTSSRDFALEAYGVSAFQYLLKPVKRQTLFALLDAIRTWRQTGSAPRFAFKGKAGITAVYQSEILYVEYRSHILYFHLENGQVAPSLHIRVPFEQAVAALLENEDFLHPHKSYVVNMGWVRQLTSDAFVMSEGSLIPIPRKNFSAVKSSYIRFLARKSRRRGPFAGLPGDALV